MTEIEHDILVENATLKSQLHEALRLAEQLRDENEDLRANFEQLRERHMQVQEHTEQYKKNFIDATKSKRYLEDQYEERVSALEAELAQRTAEVENLRQSHIPGKEIDLIRLKIAEELDGIHKKEMKQYLLELEKWRNNFHTLKREHELLKTHTEHQKTEFEMIHNESEDAHKEALASLNAQLSALRAQLSSGDGSEADRARKVQKEATELRNLNHALQEEVDEIRADNMRLKGQVEDQDKAHQRQLREERLHAQSIANQNETLSAKVVQYESERKELMRLHEEVSERLHASETHAAQVNNQLEDALQSVTNEHSNLKLHFQEQRTKWQADQEHLSRQLRDARRDFEDLEKRSMEDWAKLTAQVDATKAASETELKTVQEQMHNAERHWETVLADSQVQLERVSASAQQLREELEATKSSLAVVQRERRDLETLRNDQQQRVAQQMERTEHSEQQLRTAQKELLALRDENTNLKSTVTSVRLQASNAEDLATSLKDDVARLQQERTQHRSAAVLPPVQPPAPVRTALPVESSAQLLVQQLQNEQTSEREAHLEAKVKRLKSQLKRAISLARKAQVSAASKIREYQELARDAEDRTASAAQRAARDSLEHEQERQKLQQSVKEVTRQLREAERKREELEFSIKLQRSAESIPPQSAYWAAAERESQRFRGEIASLGRHLETLDEYQSNQMNQTFSGTRKA
eukprot:TRINITY_DN23184_c0_g1_i1.p1 TRINITY_DN23184_c0_g1~~TRINITY_DN23184_c0_g1_i1.p1  ORF type:complete len:699 (-),score=153.70 TRINITY_DN23184_c0_g1_i1:195-2291(-)